MLAKEQTDVQRIDPRTKRTRQLILRAFDSLLAEKSFEALTVQDITERATINRATFYAHFEDKYDLMNHSFTEMFQQVLFKNLKPGAPFTPTNVQRLIQTICEFLQQLHEHCAPSGRPQFASLLEQQIRQQLYNVLLNWLKPDTPKASSQADPELRATVASWTIYGAATWWSQGHREIPAPEFARQTLPMVMAGLESNITARKR